MKFKIKKSYYRLFSVLLSLVMIVISVPIVSIGANAVDEDFSGIWLFNNVKYDTKFIHINNVDDPGENEIIELHNYNKYWALRWYIISVGGGYYKIESVLSDLVLTAPTGYNNDIVRQTTYTGANTQLWKFIKQSDGTYKISPKSNHNCYLVAGAVSPYVDQDLEIRSAQTDNTDKWNLIDINYQYHASIQHYYDWGYMERFLNVSSSHPSHYQDVCSAILSQLFNVKVTYSAKLFESSADLCAHHSDSLNTKCSTHDTQDNIRSNVRSLYGSGNATTARVIWTGHKLTDSQSKFYDYDQTIMVTVDAALKSDNTNQSNPYLLNRRIYTLLHETSHFLGAVDHYCYDNQTSGDCNNPGGNCWFCDLGLTVEPTCLMSSQGMLDLKTRLDNNNLSGIYCNICTSSTNNNGIPKHLNNHH